MLYELGDGSMLLISVQCGKHGADGMFADDRTRSLDRIPFEVTQIVVYLTRGL